MKVIPDAEMIITNGPLFYCPWRIKTEMLATSTDTYQNFMYCMKENCACYERVDDEDGTVHEYCNRETRTFVRIHKEEEQQCSKK